MQLGDLNVHDERLLLYGLDGLTTSDKNDLYYYVATTNKLPMSSITDEYMLNYYKDLKIKSFSDKCDEDIAKGFTSQVTGHTYRTTQSDMFNMLAIYTIVKDDASVTTVMFRADDLDAQVSHTKDDFLSVVKEGFSFVQGIDAKFDDKKAKIKACSSPTDAYNVSWEA